MSHAIDPTMNLLGADPRTGWHVSASDVNMVRGVSTPKPVTVPAGSRKVTFDMSRTALIIVDMQNDFCHPDGWLSHIGVDVSPARKPIAPLTRLIPALRVAGARIVWVNWGNRPDRLNLPPGVLHVYNPTGAGIGLGDPLPKSGAPVLQSGSWSAAIVDELLPDAADVRVEKFRMSGFQGTVLDSILRNLGVMTLLFAGVNSDQCVMYTLQDANALGYDCLMLEDCTSTTSPEFCHAAAIYNVNQCYGFVINSGELARGM